MVDGVFAGMTQWRLDIIENSIIFCDMQKLNGQESNIAQLVNNVDFEELKKKLLDDIEDLTPNSVRRKIREMADAKITKKYMSEMLGLSDGVAIYLGKFWKNEKNTQLHLCLFGERIEEIFLLKQKGQIAANIKKCKDGESLVRLFDGEIFGKMFDVFIEETFKPWARSKLNDRIQWEKYKNAHS